MRETYDGFLKEKKIEEGFQLICDALQEARVA